MNNNGNTEIKIYSANIFRCPIETKIFFPYRAYNLLRENNKQRA